MTFQMGGIASGMDTNTLIEQLVMIERQPIYQMQARQQNYNTQISKLGQLNAQLNDLKSSLEGLDSRDELLALNPSSTDEDKMRITATGDATPGSYDLTISQLAKAEKDRSVAFASDLDAVKAGTITLTVKDEDPVDVEITEGMSLRDVAEEINRSGAEVTATIVNDGTNSYMVLTGFETGHTIGGAADDAIQITESYTGATGTELGLTQIVQAQNALFNIDGLDVEKETNLVADVVDGVTFELVGKTDATTPTVSATLVPDISTVKERIQTFVDSYNKIMSFIDSESSVTEGEDRETKLAGDSALSRIQTGLQGVIAAAVDGVTGNFQSLAGIGITSDQSNGTLAVDSGDLTDALEEDFLGAADVLIHEDTGIAAQLLAEIDIFTDSHDGTIKLRQDGIQNSIDLLEDQIENREMRVESYRESLVRQFAGLETSMSNWNAQGSYLAAFS